MDEWYQNRTDGWMYRWMDAWMDGCMDYLPWLASGKRGGSLLGGRCLWFHYTAQCFPDRHSSTATPLSNGHVISHSLDTLHYPTLSSTTIMSVCVWIKDKCYFVVDYKITSCWIVFLVSFQYPNGTFSPRPWCLWRRRVLALMERIWEYWMKK